MPPDQLTEGDMHMPTEYFNKFYIKITGEDLREHFEKRAQHLETTIDALLPKIEELHKSMHERQEVIVEFGRSKPLPLDFALRAEELSAQIAQLRAIVAAHRFIAARVPDVMFSLDRGDIQFLALLPEYHQQYFRPQG